MGASYRMTAGFRRGRLLLVRDPSIRASDADREEVGSILRENLAEGRLTMEEFDQRLEAAYAARTYGDLDSLVTDLPPRPGTGPTTLSDAKTQFLERLEARRANKYRRSWSRFVTVNTVIWAAWAVALLAPGHHNVEDLWPLWLTVPWAALLIARRPMMIAGHSRSDDVRRRRYP